jgi:hypothetical protein
MSYTVVSRGTVRIPHQIIFFGTDGTKDRVGRIGTPPQAATDNIECLDAGIML